MAAARKLSGGQKEVINHPPPPKRKRGQSVWTPERRAAAAERARRLKPSRHSTGPKTAAGKARSSLNAWKHGFYCKGAKDLRSALRRYNQFLKDINRMISAAKRLPPRLCEEATPTKQSIGYLSFAPLNGLPRRYAPRYDVSCRIEDFQSPDHSAIKGACFPNKTK